MAKIYKLFSTAEESPHTHTLDSAQRVLPLIRRYTEQAIQDSDQIAARLASCSKRSPSFKNLSKAYDQAVMRWVEKVHRLGGLAKGLWLVDFDTGSGYLCWSYPETKIEYFHSYESGFQNREKISTSAELTKHR